MITSRQSKIAQIISYREPFLKDIEARKDALSRVSKVISELEELRKQIIKDGPPAMTEVLKGIQLDILVQKIAKEIQALDKPINRFTRKTLNIGVIGRTGQGKSRLLQSLSDLGTEVIPTGRGSFCTGVRSLICHDPDKKREGGEIHFYSEQEFLKDVLAPYYKRLKLGVPPSSISNFANHPLPLLDGSAPQVLSSLDNPNGPGYVSSGEMYRHLEIYQNNIHAYRNLIGELPRSIPIQEVRKYVAQDDQSGNIKYYNHLAVREAKITCTFAHNDVGQIALLDMPGLGDTGVGDDMRLLQALEEHIDTVLFVLMPSPKRGVLADHDFGLYDLAYHALNGIPIKEWAFMVLNHIYSPNPDDDNYDNCKRIKDQVESAGTGIQGRRIEVVECIIADCTKSLEAKEKVLEKILDYLVDNMHRLDTLYMSTWEKSQARLKADIAAELDKARRTLDAGTTQFNDDRRFEEVLDTLWKQLSTALEGLLKQLREESLKPNEVFADYFKEKFAKCRSDTGLPSLRDIELLRNDVNAYGTAFNMSLDIVRTHLTHHFVDMDERLKLSMDEAKSRVTDVFMHYGKLKDFLAASGTPSAQLFKVLATHDKLSEHLRETFHVFDTYELSLHGFFQSRIRNAGYLNNLIPDRTSYSYLTPKLEKLRQVLPGVDNETFQKLMGSLMMFLLDQTGTVFLSTRLDGLLKALPGIDRAARETLGRSMEALFLDEKRQKIAEPKPAELLQALTQAQKDTVDQLEKMLENFVDEPSKATLAAVEEFVDQVLRARDAKRDWSLFYRENRPQIWSADFRKTLLWQEYQREWQVQVKNVLDANQHL